MIEASQNGFSVRVVAQALLTFLTIPAAITVSIRNVLTETQNRIAAPRERVQNVQSSVQFEQPYPVNRANKAWKKENTKAVLDKMYVTENLIPTVRELQSRMGSKGVPISIGTAQSSIDEWKNERGIR